MTVLVALTLALTAHLNAADPQRFVCPETFQCGKLQDGVQLAWVSDNETEVSFVLSVDAPDAPVWVGLGVSPGGMVGSSVAVAYSPTGGDPSTARFFLVNKTLAGLVPPAAGDDITAASASMKSRQTTLSFSMRLHQKPGGGHGHRRGGGHSHGSEETDTEAVMGEGPPKLYANAENTLVWAFGKSSSLALHAKSGVARWSVADGLIGDDAHLNASYIVYFAVLVIILFAVALHVVPLPILLTWATRVRLIQFPRSHLSRAASLVTCDFFEVLKDITVREGCAMVVVAVAAVIAAVLKHATVTRLDAPVGRVFGELALASTTVTLIPVTRNSVLLPLCGISFERILHLHRLLSRVVWLCTTVHFVLMLFSDHGGAFLFGDTRIATVGEPLGGGLFGFLAWVCLTGYLVSSHEIVRRRQFFVFYWTHVALLLPFLLLLLLHHMHLPLLAPAALYTIDVAVRWVCAKKANVLSATSSPLGATLTLESGIQFRPGAFVFLNVPGISSLKWHPFSIASVPSPGVFTVIIKPIGHNTWSSRVVDLVTHGNLRSVRTDGPYGCVSIPLESLSSVVLMGWGIGVTPVLAILETLVNNRAKYPHLKDILFLWTVRTTAHATALRGHLQRLRESAPHDLLYTQHVYITRPDVGSANHTAPSSAPTAHGPASPQLPQSIEMTAVSSPPAVPLARPQSIEMTAVSSPPAVPPLEFESGRPNIELPLDEQVSRHGAIRTGVIACGPAGALRDVQASCFKRRIWFHKEIFAF